MKRLQLPSVAQVGAALAAVIRRFPWAFFMAALGTGSAVALVELGAEAPEARRLAARLLQAAVVGLPLAIAVELLAEALRMGAIARRLAEIAGVVGAGLYFLGLPPAADHPPETVIIRTVVLAFGLHFAVAFTPIAAGSGEDDFWDFNWRLFLRFWLGALYSAVLFLGLFAAVASASRLFELAIRPERYAELWLVVVGLFNTCFVLHGMPSLNRAPPGARPYPRGLSVFAQFALAPLVVVFLAILYPYAAKIIVRRSWPDGWVALPILCLAVAGVLAALFLHPIRERPAERWAAWYWRRFFRALLPLTILLYLAVRVRVGEYGVTEARYYGFVLAGWLAVVSAYYWRAVNRSIRWLPASLAGLCLLTPWGPWGAFRVSEQSQIVRLEAMLGAHGLLVGGVLTPRPQTLEPKALADLQSTLRYLWMRHDSALLERLLAPYRAATASSGTRLRSHKQQNAWAETENLLTWLGLTRGSAATGRFTVQLGPAPGSIAGSYRVGVAWNLNRWANVPAGAAAGRLGWPKFDLDRATGSLT